VDGNFLTGGVCFPCDGSCQTCNEASSSDCTACPDGSYLSGGSCYPCDGSCKTCSAGTSSDCTFCVDGEYVSSGSCSPCDGSCQTCNGAGSSACTSCAVNKYLSWTSCYDTCDSPLVKGTIGSINYCKSPCSGQFALLEGGCGSCASPRTKLKVNGFDVCGVTCTDTSKYYYWNASCLSTCPYPLKSTIDPSGIKFCTNPCGTSSNYLFYNQSCLSTCPSPLSAIVNPGVQYCLTPCSSGSFLYENKTCIGNCPSPFVKRFEPNAQFCDRPCDSGLFWYRNGSCIASCPTPYVQSTYSAVLQCLPPCKDSEFFYEFDKECNSQCESPFSIKYFDIIKICYSEIPISLSETAKIQDAAASIQSQGDMASGGMKAAGAMNSGSPSSALLAGLSSMLQYIRYMKINYPPKVQMLFVVSAGSPISLGFDFNIPDSVAKKLDDNKLPDVFEKYDINSNFVNNLWDFLMTLLLILVVMGVFWLLKFMVSAKKYPRIHLVLSKILGAMKWNVPIMMVCSSSGDIFFYASLQIRSSHLNSFSEIICFCVGIVMMASVFVILVIGLKILKNFRDQERDSDWAYKWKGYEILYEEYEEKSIWSLSYMILFIIRGIIFNLTLANLFNFPLIQCIIINITNVLMLGYLLYLRPLKNFLNLVQLFVNEGLVNIIGVSIIILAIMDKAGINGQSTRVSVGDAIYLVIKVFNTFGLVFMGLGLLLFLIFMYKTWRHLKAQKINSPMKIFKAMILGEVTKKELEASEVLKRARIRKPPRKHSTVQETNQTQTNGGVIYLEETEMSRVQMVTDVNRSDIFSIGNMAGDLSPTPSFSPNFSPNLNGLKVPDLQITELEKSEFEIKEENSPGLQIFSIEKSSQTILGERIGTGVPEINITGVHKNENENNKSIEFLQNWRKFKGRMKRRGTTNMSLHQDQVMEVNEKEEAMEEKGEAKVLDISVTENLQTNNSPKRNGGFIQDWGRFKGRMKSREPTNLSLGQDIRNGEK